MKIVQEIERSICNERVERGVSWGLTRSKKFVRGKEYRLEVAVKDIPQEWHLADRVLCWLMPEFYSATVDYYLNNGPILRELVSPEFFKKIDSDLYELLRAYFEPDRRVVSNAKLIENYFCVSAMVKRTPSLDELDRYGKYAVRLYHSRFGGYRKFLTFVAEVRDSKLRLDAPSLDDGSVKFLSPPKPASGNLYTEKCVERLKEATATAFKRLGRLPKPLELEIWDAQEFDVAMTYFGSWANFLAQLAK